MTASEFSRLLNGRRIGKDKYVAKCPAHDDRKPSLTIAEGRQGVVIRCMSMGCETKQILDVMGLQWGALFHHSRAFDPKAAREQELQRRDAAAKRFNLRVGEWVLRFIGQGYTLEDRERDITTVCACAIVLTHKSSVHWQRILETHLARIMAAEHCRERKILPDMASK